MVYIPFMGLISGEVPIGTEERIRSLSKPVIFVSIYVYIEANQAIVRAAPQIFFFGLGRGELIQTDIS